MQEVASIIIKIPDHLRIDEVEAKMTLAAGLYQKGKLTLGQAAEFMGPLHLQKGRLWNYWGFTGMILFIIRRKK